MLRGYVIAIERGPARQLFMLGSIGSPIYAGQLFLFTQNPAKSLNVNLIGYSYSQ